MSIKQRTMLFLLAACVLALGSLAAADEDIKVVFFNQPDLEGSSATYKDKVGDGCIGCRDFGGKGNSWVSFFLAAPVRTYAAGNYSLTIYDGDKCNGNSQTSNALWGNFSTSLGNSIDSWKVCPPGKNP